MSLKPRILIAEENPEIRDLIVMHIESEFNAELIYAENVDHAIKLINNTQDFSLIVAQYNFMGKNSSRIYRFLTENKLEIPFILLTQQFPSYDEMLKGFLLKRIQNVYLKYPVKEHELVEEISRILKIKRPSLREQFRRIRGNKVAFFHKEDVPIFIMDHTNKYVQLTHISDISNDDDFYFVPTEKYAELSTKINQKLIDTLTSDAVPTVQKFEIQVDSINKIHSSLLDLGLSREEIELGQAVHRSSVEILSKNKRMSKLIGSLMKYQKYSSELIMMTNYLSVAIVGQTDWASDNSMQKLSMAAIFQDLSLQNDELVSIASTDDPRFEKLSEDLKKEVINHPAKSVALIHEVKPIQDVANNIKEVVLNHHERPLGKGFPRKLTTEHLSGLSCIFIMAHEFSHRLLYEKINLDILKKIADDFESTYSDSHFRKPYDAFKKIFHKKNIIN